MTSSAPTSSGSSPSTPDEAQPPSSGSPPQVGSPVPQTGVASRAVLESDKIGGPEFFIGVVLPLGVPWDNLTQALRTVLEMFDYSLKIIRLTDELRAVTSLDGKEEHFKWNAPPDGKYDEVRDAAIRFSMLTDKTGMALLGARRVRLFHEAKSSKYDLGELDKVDKGRDAYCFQSLKRPEEIDALRDIYGKAFVCIAAYVPRQAQSDLLAKNIAAEELKTNFQDVKGQAEDKIKSDDGDGTEGAENVRAASAKADIFVNATGTRDVVVGALRRFFSTFFLDPFQTPTPDEQGMALAHIASMRSAHPQRQVGAVVATEDGSVLAIGCNEVPAPQGGLYWTGDKDDRRDFQFERYASLALREEILRDITRRLIQSKYLSEKREEEFKADPASFFRTMYGDKDLRDSRLMDAIEYDRTVHAEMAAITDAARRGVPLQGCTLYCTTFPCHNCARHIVAAGIRRVVYIEPYVKSLVQRLHDDAICLDSGESPGSRRVNFEHFIGIAPVAYLVLFPIQKEKRLKGDRFVEWTPNRARPFYEEETWIYLRKEYRATRWLKEKLAEKNLGFKEERKHYEPEAGRGRRDKESDGR